MKYLKQLTLCLVLFSCHTQSEHPLLLQNLKRSSRAPTRMSEVGKNRHIENWHKLSIKLIQWDVFPYNRKKFFMQTKHQLQINNCSKNVSLDSSGDNDFFQFIASLPVILLPLKTVWELKA